MNNKTIFILKKDLPTIRAGRVIRLTDDGKIGIPVLMSVEEEYSVAYAFSIDTLRQEKDWFEESEQINGIAPQMII